ncbi:MAG: hypothetical protein H0W61_11520 [Bacteroidetes bacterium]|nr:hypothetical protein [Bacteroidota bacterium]
MKKTAVYILLFLYVAVQLKPLAAVMEDVLAHTFFKAKHMATIHYENGKYHLHSELESISKDETGSTKEKGPSAQKLNENINQQITHELHFDLSPNSIRIPVIAEAHQQLPSGYQKVNSPPPKQA